MNCQWPMRSEPAAETGLQQMLKYGLSPMLTWPYWAIYYLELCKTQLSWMLPVNDSTPETANHPLTPAQIKTESACYEGHGGTSTEAACAGFEPAFLDSENGCIYRSCFANGNPAPIHLLDGLPAELILAKSPEGRVSAVKPSVVAGFVRSGAFYTREQACAAQH